jgi:asparagine synthase (glutamine-hydrolysing)
MLEARLENKNGRLGEIIDKKRLSSLMEGEDVTWLGQLMSRPQLFAWLIQLDVWLSHFSVDIV